MHQVNRVNINPNLLRWARERASQSQESLSRRFPKLELWERGETMPTLKQLEAFAKATRTSIGYLFLSDLPEEHVPIPDLRTIESKRLSRPSPDLLETIYICQRRQTWYREYAQSIGNEPHTFVGSVRINASVETTAAQMRNTLGFDLGSRQLYKTQDDALRKFIALAERLGILIMTSGIVGNNTRRKLDVSEFRGFALADEYAPLIFINGADTKAAQIFTLAHELAHIWLGKSALTDIDLTSRPGKGIEQWCNKVAAELLVPLQALREYLRQQPEQEIKKLA